MSNNRAVIVHRINGNWEMAEPCQGRYTYATYATADEARRRLTEIKRNTSEDTIRQVWGPDFMETAGVRIVDCYDHGDPVASIWKA